MGIPRIICTNFLNTKKSLENAVLKRLFLKKTQNFISQNSVRSMAVYESEPKTVGTVLNKKTSDVLLITNYMSEGFILPSGDHFVGSMIIFPHAIFSWNISDAKNVTEESLVLFKLMEPKIDILIFGYGNIRDYTPEVRQNFTKYCKNLGLRFEALPTNKAVGTYNFLADERRLVAAALIPPKFVDVLNFERKNTFYLDDGLDDEEDKPEPIQIGEDSVLRKKLIK